MKITEEGRECGRCEKFKPWERYCKNCRNTTGHKTICKDCEAEMRAKDASFQRIVTRTDRLAQNFILNRPHLVEKAA